MKKPAIIDQEIEFTVYSHAMITPPMEVEDYNPDDPAELIYASAMDFITEGRTEQRRKDLDLHIVWAAGVPATHLHTDCLLDGLANEITRRI